MKRAFFNRNKRGNPAKMNTFVTVVFWASLLFFLTILAIGYYRQHHKPIKSKYSFVNLKINLSNPQLKLYSGRINYDSLAVDYANKGMPDLLRHKIWDNLDSASVPIIQYAFGKYYNPVTTSQTAQAFYQRALLNGDSNDKIRFLNNVLWLMKNHKDYYLRYEFEYRHATIPLFKKGWVSAMAQGEALGALSVAFHATGDDKYQNCARNFFYTLHTNTDSLWCFGVDSEGYYWLEEYPSENFCHVLNGMLYALWGIWDYYVVTHDQLALTLFKAGIRTVTDHYSMWKPKAQKLSYYCWHRYANADYHQLHLFQLQVFSDFFSIPELRVARAYFSLVDTTSVSYAPPVNIFSTITSFLKSSR